MKIVFAGTPDFAACALQALSDCGHEIPLVLTQPDRPAGRGLHALPSAVKRLAQSLGLEVAQPSSLKTPDVLARLKTAQADAMVVAAYGLIIPVNILAIPRLGGINIHASLLPRWRGAAPIQRALLAGDTVTGISIMQMDAGLDTGPVLLHEAIAIEPQDTALTLHDKLAALGSRLIVSALDAPRLPKPQDESQATYAAKIDKEEARINWREIAEVIARKVRAFNPAPGATTAHAGIVLKIWRAAVGPDASAEPGTVIEAGRRGLIVACGSGTSLELLELQRAGGKRVAAAAYLSGNRLSGGDRLGSE